MAMIRHGGSAAMIKQPTGKTATVKFEVFDTEIPTLGQPKVPTPIPKYAMVDLSLIHI